MERLKIIIKIVVFFAVFIGIQFVIKFAVLSDESAYGRLLMHNIYEEENNIDILVCGASHSQLGLNTSILSEAYGMNAVNV